MSLPSTPPRDGEEDCSSDSDDCSLIIQGCVSPHNISVHRPEQLDSYWAWFPPSRSEILPEQEKKLKSWIADLDEDLILQTSVRITQLMLPGFYASCQEKFSEAQAIFDTVEEALQLELNAGADPLEIEAYAYLLNANRLMNLKESGHEALAMNIFEKTISMDLSPAKTTATLLAMKCIFIGHAGLNRNKMSLFRRVVELDPDNLDWMHFHYRGVRSVRRERNFNSMPSDEEVDVCYRAYQINSNAPATVFDMATLFDDIVKSHFGTGQDHNLIRNMGFLKFTEQLLYFANRSCELNPRSIRANIHLAEVLNNETFHHRKVTTVEESEHQYLKCLEKWPRSSEVLHKVGKFYYHSRMPGGVEEGAAIMKRCLERNIDNFPCVMDYMRALIRKKVPFGSLIEILQEIVPYFRFKNVLQAKIVLMQASFYWYMECPEEATKLWVTAFEIDPGCLLENNLWDLMTSGRVLYRPYMSQRRAFNAVRRSISNLLLSQHTRYPLRAKVMEALHRSFEAHLVSQEARAKVKNSVNKENEEANAAGNHGHVSQRANFSKDPGHYKKEHFGMDPSYKWQGVPYYGGGSSKRTVGDWAAPTSEDDRSSVASTTSHFTFDAETVKLLGFSNGPSSSSSSSSQWSSSSSGASSTSGNSSRPRRPTYPKTPSRKSYKSFDTDDNWRSK